MKRSINPSVQSKPKRPKLSIGKPGSRHRLRTRSTRPGFVSVRPSDVDISTIKSTVTGPSSSTTLAASEVTVRTQASQAVTCIPVIDTWNPLTDPTFDPTLDPTLDPILDPTLEPGAESLPGNESLQAQVSRTTFMTRGDDLSGSEGSWISSYSSEVTESKSQLTLYSKKSQRSKKSRYSRKSRRSKKNKGESYDKASAALDEVLNEEETTNIDSPSVLGRGKRVKRKKTFDSGDDEEENKPVGKVVGLNEEPLAEQLHFFDKEEMDLKTPESLSGLNSSVAPEATINSAQKDVEISQEKVILAKSQVKPGRLGDSQFAKNLATILWEPNVLENRSVTGKSSNAVKGVPAKPKLTPQKMDQLKKIFIERMREEMPPPSKNEVALRCSSLNTYISQKIATLNRIKK